MSSLIRAATLKNYFEVAQQLDLNPQPLLRAAGLSRTMLTDPERRIPASAVLRLLEDSARQSGCDTFGLRMAESRQLSDFGVVSLLLIHQPTLRDALVTTMKYRHLLNELLAIHVEERGRTVVIREEFVTDSGFTSSRQAIELALGALYRLCGFLLGPHWKPHSVNFTHGAPENLLIHRRVFRCPAEFDREFNGIVCEASDLNAPNPSADPAMALYVKRLVEALPAPTRNSIATDIRKDLYILMPMGQATIEQVAVGRGMNVRTLQRRLEEANETFSDVLHSVRTQLALRYMENPQYSLQVVGRLLGFSSPSSFTRWFSGAFGMAPREWRKEYQQRG
ncbi:AraC family transcriptional regulator [Agrilutibacter solisilvae]|uniref:AraC family transcriptional regulator n=1 Tax=Agrilutibacter solisilvae TaxID=2763317 RepID=A0A974XX93_9GAMM|nr:AraC family transcriptional regulator [Lysobacter solisilvae]QSX77516.1 AraC family transcriptional regulator [Lysobacter solisilvae]